MYSGFSPWEDIADMHHKFGVHCWVRKQIKEGNYDILKKFLDFRMSCIKEEFDETNDAINKKDSEEVVDGLIDLMVFTVGTLDILGIDSWKAWKEVHKANIAKEVGVKETRPNPFGLPDLIKRKDWKAPSHRGNTGIIEKVLNSENNSK